MLLSFCPLSIDVAERVLAQERSSIQVEIVDAAKDQSKPIISKNHLKQTFTEFYR